MDREERRNSFIDSMKEELGTARTVCDEYCAICPHNTCKIKMRREEEPVHRTQEDLEAAMADVEEKSKAFTEAHQGETAIPDIVDEHYWEMLGEEPVSEDLEEEIARWEESFKHRPASMDYKETARHFANWQKQQMMKEAISGEVKEGLAVGDFGWEDSGWIETDTFRIEKYALKANDKVKLIIVKED